MGGVILAVLSPQATYPLYELQTWVHQCVYMHDNIPGIN